MQVKQITSEMQRFLPTASGAAGPRRNSGLVMQCKRLFLPRYICKIPGGAGGSCRQPPGAEARSRGGVPAHVSSLLFKCQSGAVSPICTQREQQRQPRLGAAPPELPAQISLPGGCQLLVPPGCSCTGCLRCQPQPWAPDCAKLQFKGHPRGRELCKHGSSSSILPLPPQCGHGEFQVYCADRL